AQTRRIPPSGSRASTAACPAVSDLRTLAHALLRAALEHRLQRRHAGAVGVVTALLAHQVDRRAVGEAVEEQEAFGECEARVHLVRAILEDALRARLHRVAPRADGVASRTRAVAHEQGVADPILVRREARLLARIVAVAPARALEEGEAL